MRKQSSQMTVTLSEEIENKNVVYHDLLFSLQTDCTEQCFDLFVLAA
jgi:hypothetical protein